LASIVAGDPAALPRVQETLSADKVSALPSDDRFRQVLAAVKRQPSDEKQAVILKSPRGDAVGKASFSGGEIKLTIEKSRADAFSAFLKEELPSMMGRFFAHESDG
jgi:ParB family chromosome partitioning protein